MPDEKGRSQRGIGIANWLTFVKNLYDMGTGTVAIRVDDIVRQKFMNATQQERARWEEAFNLWWKVYFTDTPQQKLSVAVDYFRQKSAERGLTPEVLDRLLSND